MPAPFVPPHKAHESHFRDLQTHPFEKQTGVKPESLPVTTRPLFKQPVTLLSERNVQPISPEPRVNVSAREITALQNEYKNVHASRASFAARLDLGESLPVIRHLMANRTQRESFSDFSIVFVADNGETTSVIPPDRRLERGSKREKELDNLLLNQVDRLEPQFTHEKVKAIEGEIQSASRQLAGIARDLRARKASVPDIPGRATLIWLDAGPAEPGVPMATKKPAVEEARPHMPLAKETEVVPPPPMKNEEASRFSPQERGTTARLGKGRFLFEPVQQEQSGYPDDEEPSWPAPSRKHTFDESVMKRMRFQPQPNPDSGDAAKKRGIPEGYRQPPPPPPPPPPFIPAEKPEKRKEQPPVIPSGKKTVDKKEAEHERFVWPPAGSPVNKRAVSNDKGKELPVSQAKAPPAPPPPPAVPLTRKEQEELVNLRNQHQELVMQFQEQEKECQDIYKRFIDARAFNEKKDRMAMTFAGTQAGKQDWMSEGAEFFGEAYKCFAGRIGSQMALINDLKVISGEKTGQQVLSLMNSLKATVDKEIHGQPGLNMSPYVARFRGLKSALLNSIGVSSLDELAKSMSREQFKRFQAVFEDKILGTGLNKVSLKILVDHFVDQELKKLPPIPPRPVPPACSWLTEDEVKLLETIGGLGYFDAPKPDSRKIPQFSFGMNGGAMGSYQALYDRVASFDKGGEATSGSNEKDREMLEKVEKLKQKIETQSEAVKGSFRKGFADFLNDKRKFTVCKRGMEAARKTLGNYTRKLLRRSMVSLSDKPPIGDDVLQDKAVDYELKKGQTPDSWFLASRSRGCCVRWCEKAQNFVEGCSQQEAEASYADNKPLLCIYDESLFASEDVFRKALDAGKEQKKAGKEVSPPPKAALADPSLLSADTLPIGFTGNKEALEKKMAALKNEVNVLRDYKQKVLLAFSKMIARKLVEDNPNIADLGDSDRPTKLAEKFSELDSNESTNCIAALETVPELKDRGDRVTAQLLRLCHDVVAEEVEKNRCSLSAVLKDLADTSLADEGMSDLKKNIKEARFEHFNLKWKSLEQSLVSKVYDRMEATGLSPQRHGQFPAVTHFIDKACRIFYKMKCQNPPMELEWLPPNTVLSSQNKPLWKPYTEVWKEGDKVDYVYWPALILHKGGPPMEKGRLNPLSKVE